MTIASILIGYFLGSIPFAYIAGKVSRGIDIRKHGTENVGTLNVLEVLGQFEAFFTFAGDAGKGAAAVLVAKFLEAGEATMMLTAFAAILGHDWPIWLRFHGGKGLATAIGITLAIMPAGLFLVGVSYALLFFPLKRHSPLVNIIAFLLLPLFAAVLGKSIFIILGFAAIVLLRALADYKSWREDIKELISKRPHTPGKRLKELTSLLWKKQK